MRDKLCLFIPELLCYAINFVILQSVRQAINKCRYNLSIRFPVEGEFGGEEGKERGGQKWLTLAQKDFIYICLLSNAHNKLS